MTETGSGPTSAQQERIARLRARRGQATELPAPTGPALATSSSPQRRRTRHVARGSRVAAAGLGAVTMLGIVTVLGLDHPLVGAGDPPPPSPPGPTSPASPPIQVVIHRTPATAPATAPAVDAATTMVDAAGAEAPPASDAPPPIVLTANPVVQNVTVTGPSRSAPTRASSPTASAPSAPAPAPAPSATTSGSN